MNYDAISQLLDNGISEDEILSSLVKSLPKLGKQASKLMAGGWNASQILSIFSKEKEVQKTVRKGLKPTTPNEIAAMRLRDSYQNIPKNQEEQSTEEIEGVLRKGAPLAMGLAAPYVMRAAAPMAQAAIERVLPNSLKGLGQKMSQAPVMPGNRSPQGIQQGIPETQKILQTQQPPASNLGGTIPEATQITQPQVIGIDSSAILSKHGDVKGKIDELIKSGNGPEEISAYFENFMKKKKRKSIEKDAKMPFDKILEDYIAKNSMQANNLPKDLPIDVKEVIEPESIKEIEPPKIEKASTVATPQGIGEVKEIRNGKAIVEVDGKFHKVKEEDLQPPAFSDDEIADAYDNLMAKIPEEHRSGFISWAGYDEDRNVLGFIPRGGKYEELQNITPEEAKMIKEGKGVARTTGETREGLWVAGEDTRGGVISQIIWDRKHKKQAEEEKQLKLGFELPKVEKVDRGMKPQFDEMKHARELSRERERKKKLEEREKKKKEKDEAKKRKK